MWMMPLHLHVNQKSDYDYDDDMFKSKLIDIVSANQTCVFSVDLPGINHSLPCVQPVVLEIVAQSHQRRLRGRGCEAAL